VSAKKRPSRRPTARDIDPTPFSAILDHAIARLPGAFGAALVDGEGETVDYAGLVDPFEIRVSAAHLQIVMRQLEGLAAVGIPKFLVIRGAKRTIVARALPDGYVLAVLFRRRAGFNLTQRGLAACERELAREAGWPAPSGRGWYAVDVAVDRRGRPVSVAPDVAVDVLGTVMGLPRREQAFRVRTAAGHEVTLVREPRRVWYADEDLANASNAPTLPGERGPKHAKR
jgi:hypothetical protein